MKAFLSGALLILVSATANAHHSHPEFLIDQDSTVQGTIESIHFANPHVVMTLRTVDTTVYTIEWQSATWLASAPAVFVTPTNGPVTAESLHVGDYVIVIGAPPRDPSRHELVTLKSVHRPSDGWTWTCRRPSFRHNC
jgi:hypothetical protein